MLPPPVPANSALVFVKPHACTAATVALAKETLGARGLRILAEGDLSGPEIDERQLIDNHYYSIAAKATLTPPAELNVPEDKFADKFGVGWKEALEQGVVFNAKGACEKLGVDAHGLEKLWRDCEKAGDLIKFGGGFYCGKIGELYVFNAFFMAMRSAFVAPEARAPAVALCPPLLTPCHALLSPPAILLLHLNPTPSLGGATALAQPASLLELGIPCVNGDNWFRGARQP